MPTRFVTVLTLCGLVFGSTGCRARGVEFDLKDRSGKVWSVGRGGEVWVVHFWASWCAPCVEEVPEWVRWRPPSGVRKIAISVDESWADANRIWPKSAHLGEVLVLDIGGTVAKDHFGSFEYPESYLIREGQDGAVVLHKWVGPVRWESPILKREIEEAIARVR